MEKGKCDMCGDEKEVRCLEDKELQLSLNVCEDCIEYTFWRVGVPSDREQ